jgi:GDP-L-fucose synthase
MYPRETEQPIKEEALLTGPLEPTNEPYAIAKSAGIKLCESLHHQYGNNFYSLMPCNLYGINDNFDLETSHVLPALIRKVHEAKINKEEEVEIWGSGKPLREFLLVDDLAEVIEKCIQSINAEDLYEQGISQLNVGVGKDITIKKLTEEIMHTVGFKGKLSLDKTKPDGMMRKVMDVSRLEKLNLHNPTSLKDGLKQTYKWYKEKGCQNLKT